jgi:hypothetical protein
VGFGDEGAVEGAGDEFAVGAPKSLMKTLPSTSGAWSAALPEAVCLGGRNLELRLDAMDLADEVPVDCEPAEECAGEGDEGELQFGDPAEIAGRSADSGDDGAKTEDEQDGEDAVEEHEVFVPRGSWRK